MPLPVNLVGATLVLHVSYEDLLASGFDTSCVFFGRRKLHKMSAMLSSFVVFDRPYRFLDGCFWCLSLPVCQRSALSDVFV